MANRMEAMRAKAQAMKSKAAEAGKAKQAQKSAMVDKLKSAMATRQSAASARPTERIPRPAGTVSPNAAKMVGKPLGGAPTRPMGGGMGSRPAMTPQVKQGLQGMADKTREAVMQRGKPTLISGMKKGGRAKK